jgi:hypothetical protein
MFASFSRPLPLCALFASLLLFLPACREQRVEVRRLAPTSMHLEDIGSLAMAAVEGRGGDDIGDLVADELGRTQHFEVVDRQVVLRTLADRHPWKIEPGEVREVGQLLGVDALIFGQVVANDYRDDLTAEQHTLGSHASTTFARAGELRLSLRFKVLSVQTGKLLGSRTFTVIERVAAEQVAYDGRAAGVACPEKLFANVDVESLRLAAYTRIARRLVHHVVPHYEFVQVKLYSDRSLPESSVAVEAAQRGDWPVAIDVYRRATEAMIHNSSLSARLRARAFYNYGVALAYSGALTDGLAQLQQAQVIYPDKVFAAEIERLEATQRELEQVQDQTLQVTCGSGDPACTPQHELEDAAWTATQP